RSIDVGEQRADRTAQIGQRTNHVGGLLVRTARRVHPEAQAIRRSARSSTPAPAPRVEDGKRIERSRCRVSQSSRSALFNRTMPPTLKTGSGSAARRAMYLHHRSERPRAVAIPFHVSTKLDMPGLPP